MTAYCVDDVAAAMSNLNDLIDIICQIQFEVNPGNQADRRVDSLLWIARDLSEGIIAKRNEESKENSRRAQA